MRHQISTKNISKSWGGVRAVDDLSVHIPEGKITGIVGPNGSGKTTLINLISGLFGADYGLTVISGVERSKINPWENPAYGVTRTFQQVRIFEQMTVLDNLLVVLTERSPLASIFEKHTKLHLVRAHDILKKVGLEEKKNSLGENLSYGQRKLLEIARVMAMDSQIILLDEPFAGLFPEMVKQIAGFVAEWKHEGKTIILVEHNMSLIRELCDHLIVMDAGKMLAEGAPEEVLSKKEVMEAYLGE
jgi:ABC-type branched-subunit amino acid transport system ATPase component